MTASVSVAGTRRSRSAANSSSTKNGLPPDARALERRPRPEPGRPAIASSWRATSARLSGRRRRAANRGRRTSSVSSRRIGCAGGSSPVRYVSATAIRSPRRFRARNATRSRVERSAQCMSSSTSSGGASSASRRASNSQHALDTAVPGRGGREQRAVGSPSASRPARARRRTSRSAATSGAYANSSPPNSTHSPWSTRKPRSRARASSSPRQPRLAHAASPASAHDLRLAARAPRSARRRAGATRSRPTMVRLETRRNPDARSHRLESVAGRAHAPGSAKRPPDGGRFGFPRVVSAIRLRRASPPARARASGASRAAWGATSCARPAASSSRAGAPRGRSWRR